MGLCDSCSRLEIQRLPPTKHPEPPGFELGTLREVCQRAERCDLCDLLREYLFSRQIYANYVTAEGTVVEDKADLTVSLRRSPKDSFAPKEITSLSGFDVSLGSRQLTFSVNLYALRGSPAAAFGDVVNHDLCMPLDPNSLTAVELARKWLKQCETQHEQCRQSFSGETIENSSGVAPSRLLYISPIDLHLGLPEVRLVATEKSISAPYVSLSHCWGPPEERPLCTIKENLKAHMEDVPWAELSQTFRDACLFCSKLGMSYIWIDSLCIVQDDPEDWKREAAIMCKVYEESEFTIAASSAPSSSAGLFGVRSTIKFVELPYHHRPSGTNDSVYAYLSPPAPGTTVDKAPLNKRAWVLQEYVLSRRTIHFTIHGMVWSCSREPAMMLDEFNSRGSHLVPNTWIAMIREYTKRSLTYKSDKLMAIQGLANAWARKSRDTYYYGVFLEDLPHSLMWMWSGMMQDRLVRDVGCGVPSWTWASATGPVDFETIEDYGSIAPVCHDITPFVELPGALQLRATVKEVASFYGPFDCLPNSIEEIRDVGPNSGDQLQDKRWCNHINHTESYFVLLDSANRSVGWGAFDEAPKVPAGPISCLPLVKAGSRPWYMPPVETAEPFFLWCLLVRKTNHANGYERVGYGRVLEPHWAEEEAEKVIYLI